LGPSFLGAANALPETVTAIAAVRPGAVTLVIAAIIGGNSFHALNLVVGGIAYRSGSLFHTASPDELFVAGAALLMTTVLLGGLLVRQQSGWWRVWFDGILLAALYAAIMAVLLV
jgi:cation:H+ antiporter